ncbi:MAG: hypothetical protein Q8O67_22445 [Deltaproteobacteria bacterium]|nr:hypothetical protein [Deltaproteobacteria bacterium]
MPRFLWVTHPRHLPKPPAGRAVVVDVAFAAAGQWKSKTKPFIDGLGDRLVMYVDHHEHREAWPLYVDDPRFLLVQNRIAHACPELVTPELCARAGVVDVVVAHHDFDGLLSAVKFVKHGKMPWPEADEDARAIDSPGRGHLLSPMGARLALAMDQSAVSLERPKALDFNTRLATALVDSASLSPELDDEVDTLAKGARIAEDEARAIVDQRGKLEAPGVFVVRVARKQDNRMRRNLLVLAEERAKIGALFEPDPQGGAWMTAATFDPQLDLEDVAGFEGGRSDYRFARAHGNGSELVDALSKLTLKT